MHGSLLAIASQYSWQLAGAMLIGAGLLRNGWLAGPLCADALPTDGAVAYPHGPDYQPAGAVVAQW